MREGPPTMLEFVVNALPYAVLAATGIVFGLMAFCPRAEAFFDCLIEDKEP